MTTDISSDGLMSVYEAFPPRRTENHGYTEIADVDITDEKGSMILPVSGGENLTENYVSANFARTERSFILKALRKRKAATPTRISLSVI